MSVANKLKTIFLLQNGRFAKASQFLCIMGINTVVLRSGWQKRFYIFRIVVSFVIFHLTLVTCIIYVPVE